MTDKVEVKRVKAQVGKLKDRYQDFLSDKNIKSPFIDKLIALAGACFEKARAHYPFDADWYIHTDQILHYIDEFIEKSGLKVSPKEKSILFMTAVLHDIGKGLPDLHERLTKTDINLSIGEKVKELAASHHILTYILLKNIIDSIDKKTPATDTPNATNDIIKNMNKIINDNDKKKYKDYLQAVAWVSLRHKEIPDKLFQEFKEPMGITKGISREELFTGKNPEIAETIKFLNNGAEDTEAPNRFDIISALFQLGDKLDISGARLERDSSSKQHSQGKERSNPYFYLEVFLDDIDFEKREKTTFSHYKFAITKWYQFYYTGTPSIERINKDIHIVIPYRYPEYLRQDFPYFRYEAEKDFEDLAILFTLEMALRKENKDEDYRVIIARTENKGGEGGKPERIIGLQYRNERLLYCLSKICPAYQKNPSFREYVNSKFGGTGEINQCDQNGRLCFLWEYVQKVFEKNEGQVSHPALGESTLKGIENLDTKECIEKIKKRNDKGDRGKLKKFLATLKDPDLKILPGLTQSALEGLRQWKQGVESSLKTTAEGTLFYESRDGSRFIPVSMDVAYLLNLFRHLRNEPLKVEDIINLSGLDRGRVLKYCGRLEHEGFLILDTKEEAYKINIEKIARVEKALADFDKRRSELVSRVRDIERFGKPLALFSDVNEVRLKTNITGFDDILSPFEKEKRGLPLRKSLLLIGPPGSGKTTLALEIVRQIRLQRLPEETALYLTFEEDIRRLADDFNSLGWSYDDMDSCVRSLSTLQSKTYLNDPDKFLKHFLNILDEFAPDFVALDNFGYLLQLVPSQFSREILNRLMRVFAVRGITALFLGESIPHHLEFEAYDVDGIINIGYEKGQRWLEISKLRGREFAGGRHIFEIRKPGGEKDRKANDEPVVRLYPNIQMHIAHLERELEDKLKRVDVEPKREIEILSSGIIGLDDLLPIYPAKSGQEKKNGFEKGEFVLVIGSPGAGKTLLGLHFLKAKLERDGWNNERVLWISFESNIEGLKLATRGFSDDSGLKKLIQEMIPDNDNKNGNIRFKFYAPAWLKPDELANFLLAECGKSLSRLVLDSVTDLEQVFPTEIEFKSFMTSLAQILRDKGVTTMFLYRTKRFFGKSEDVGRVLSSVVDTIVCLKVLEINNAIQKGLFLLKVRGREHRSKLVSLEFREDKDMVVADRGWTMSGLISGEAGQIKEPRVSVKLFFENRNEFLINSLIVNEYNRRFKGGQTSFVHVMKPQIYSEFWSFRGSSGAGHANVRVVSLCDYWAVLFHSQGKLHNLWEYVSAETRQLIRLDEFKRRCASYSFKENDFNIFAIPNYVDVGVLAYHQDIKNLTGFWTALSINPPANEEQTRKNLSNLTWNQLTDKNIVNIAKKIKVKKQSGPSYIFAMPSLNERATFVSFFLEVYWSFGGVIFDFSKSFNNYADYCLCRCGYKVDSDNKHKGMDFLPFFNFTIIDLSEELEFLAEILLLIPERILNQAIREMNKTHPNFVGDVCRHGDVLLNSALKTDKHPGASAVKNLEAPLGSFLLENRMSYVEDFVQAIVEGLEGDELWKKQPSLIEATKKIQEIVKNIISENGDNTNYDKRNLLIILSLVFSRVVTNYDRYLALLEWRKRGRKTFPEDIIHIGKGDINHIEEPEKLDDPVLVDTLDFLYQLIKNGIAPNPYGGDFTRDAYLARKWTGDIAPQPSLPQSKELGSPLDMNCPVDAYELDKVKSGGKDIDLPSPYHIAPLPSYKRNVNDKNSWSYAVLGLWSLGITTPALSPEIGWIFIDALTEDKFVELRARVGLGLPAKVSAYERASIYEKKPEIYGKADAAGILREGIVQYYGIARQDKPTQTDGIDANTVIRRTRERAAIPYYYKIEEILYKELSRFFNPSFFNVLPEDENGRKAFLKLISDRIHIRIKNFLDGTFQKTEKNE